MYHINQISAVINGNMRIKFKRCLDMLVIFLPVDASDSKDRNMMILNQGGRDIILGGKGVRGA